MHIPSFPKDKGYLDRAYDEIRWLPDTGLTYEELKTGAAAVACDETLPKSIRKAKMFDYLLSNARLAVDRDDIFQDKINAAGIMNEWIWRWERETFEHSVPKTLLEERQQAKNAGAYAANPDYGHISPNVKNLFTLGIPGLLERIRCARAEKADLPESQAVFYLSCEITLEAIVHFLKRLSDAVKADNPMASACLSNLSEHAPGNCYEALMLLDVYFVLHERIAGARVRTLGRLDVELEPFYLRDTAENTFTRGEIFDLLKYFLNKFWAARVPFDQPMMIGGSDGCGHEQTGELTEMILDAYDELNIHSPKLHIRISKHTPDAFLSRVLRCIRGGNSSILLLNEEKAIEGLERIGIEPEDAKNVVLIGCYESAVAGVEIPCTGNGSVNLPKALSYVFTRGIDAETGVRIGLDTGIPETYDDFVTAVKAQISHLIGKALDTIRTFEPLYMEIYPDPLLSCQYDVCVERGRDAYAAGAKYNSSALNAMGIAPLTDAVSAVRHLVYEQQRLTLSELGKILSENWAGHENLRAEVLHMPDKYGNADPAADAVMLDFSDFISHEITGKSNGRGGVFKAGLYSIDHCFTNGVKTQATPDGRYNGEMLSKNLCAVTCMDKKGITAYIRSVAKIDHAGYPNGTVLDFVLHPTAVSGDDGLAAMLGLVRTYFSLGGFAMHGNIFDGTVLREAQEHPERYQTLQVRLCGWNVYFVNLSRQEQDDFIRQCERV
ncbi:MAG: hypothetical protein MJ175_06575 [Clostridia bacterium]|nr:hypothetical protein [Clostridia bacterium]